ncbi:hypothetical protein BV20DRAFT_125534 [Pilatotrama ljubarskyi]|nr:hypothetical protein BV20DRAFT_125534 [Pilatotrama ljubarskyi]
MLACLSVVLAQMSMMACRPIAVATTSGAPDPCAHPPISRTITHIRRAGCAAREHESTNWRIAHPRRADVVPGAGASRAHSLYLMACRVLPRGAYYDARPALWALCPGCLDLQRGSCRCVATRVPLRRSFARGCHGRSRTRDAARVSDPGDARYPSRTQVCGGWLAVPGSFGAVFLPWVLASAPGRVFALCSRVLALASVIAAVP